MVSPPPGVSSASISPPMASMKPFATARPRPTPSLWPESPSRWNGLKSRSHSERWTPGPRSTTRTSTTPSSTPAVIRGGDPAGENLTAFEMTLARARSRRPRSASTRGSVSGTSSCTEPSGAPRLWSAAGKTSSRPTGTVLISRAPTWSRLMSSRLPMSALSRSVSSSIVSRNSWRASGVQSTSRCSRLVTDALTAEIGVRRSWETAASSAARSSLAAERPPAVSASASSSPRWTEAASSLAKASSTRWSSLRIGPPVSASTCSASSSMVSLLASGLSGMRSPLAASIRQPPSRRWSTAAPSRPRTRQRPSSSAETVEEPASRESASASARARAPSAALRAASATKPETIAPTTRKTKSASTSSASAIVSVWWGSMKK